MKKNTAFTLVEIIIVVVVLGVLSSLALVQYSKTVRQAYEREATNQLLVLHGANAVMRSRTGSYLTGTGLPLAQINSGLGLNITASSPLTYSYTYSYDPPAPALPLGMQTYEATATYTGAGGNFSILVWEAGVNTAMMTPSQDWLFEPHRLVQAISPFNNFWVGEASAQTPPSRCPFTPGHSFFTTGNNPCCKSGSCPRLPNCDVCTTH